jgi:hypothetical protein
MNDREAQPPGLTILGQCGQGLRLVSNRVAAWEWESIPRRAQHPRYRQRRLAPWRSKHIEHRAEKQQGLTNSQSPRSNSETEA